MSKIDMTIEITEANWPVIQKALGIHGTGPATRWPELQAAVNDVKAELAAWWLIIPATDTNNYEVLSYGDMYRFYDIPKDNGDLQELKLLPNVPKSWVEIHKRQGRLF